MKKIFLFFVFASLSIQLVSAQIVYVTKSGKKYHSKTCSLAKTGKVGVLLVDAKKQGYTACSNCKIEATEPKKKKQ